MCADTFKCTKYLQTKQLDTTAAVRLMLTLCIMFIRGEAITLKSVGLMIPAGYSRAC